jgi:hypothetical protein
MNTTETTTRTNDIDTSPAGVPATGVPATGRLSLDEARTAIDAAERLADQRFIHDYEALIAKYGRRLAGEVVIRTGLLPEVRIVIERL